MEIIIILITAIFLLVMLITSIYYLIEYDDSYISSFIFIATLSLIEKPKAIDVYRGNTTLEITYKNGIAVDSTVVFKNK